jgi:hypothetical protein
VNRQHRHEKTHADRQGKSIQIDASEFGATEQMRM